MATSAQALPVRRRDESRLLRWLTSTNHKQIGIAYLTTAFSFFSRRRIGSVADAVAAWCAE